MPVKLERTTMTDQSRPYRMKRRAESHDSRVERLRRTEIEPARLGIRPGGGGLGEEAIAHGTCPRDERRRGFRVRGRSSDQNRWENSRRRPKSSSEVGRCWNPDSTPRSSSPKRWHIRADSRIWGE